MTLAILVVLGCIALFAAACVIASRLAGPPVRVWTPWSDSGDSQADADTPARDREDATGGG